MTSGRHNVFNGEETRFLKNNFTLLFIYLFICLTVYLFKIRGVNIIQYRKFETRCVRTLKTKFIYFYRKPIVDKLELY